MKFLSVAAGLCLIASAALASTAALAKPAAPGARPEISATIPFDPPLGETLRFRGERTVEKDGKSEMGWWVSDYRFDAADDGYRLTITPVSSGSGTQDPLKLALEKKLSELSAIPYVLSLSEAGEITAMENADHYWDRLISALDEAMSETLPTEKRPAPEVRRLLANVVDLYRNLPAETRLALLVEETQPVIEFGNTEWDAEPVVAKIETPSPFGAVAREIRISLKSVDRDVARLTLRSSIPRSDLEKVTSAFLQKTLGEALKDSSELDKAMSHLGSFTHETVADYDLSLADGLLVRLRSTETIEVVDGGGKLNRQVTTRSIDWIE